MHAQNRQIFLHNYIAAVIIIVIIIIIVNANDIELIVAGDKQRADVFIDAIQQILSSSSSLSQ